MTTPTSHRQGAPLRILLLARYGMSGPSSRIRHYQYIAPLAARGVEIDAHHLIDDDSVANSYRGRPRRWDRIAAAYMTRLIRMRNLNRYQVAWIEKEALPGLPYLFERRLFEQSHLATIIDFDDFWIARYGNGGVRARNSGRERAKLAATFRAATLVTAANSALAELLRDATGRKPAVCENRIDVERYRRASNTAEAARFTPNAPVRIGWIGTPYAAAAYLPIVAPALNQLAREGVSETVLIGAGSGASGVEASRVPWTLEGEVEAIAGIDIGVQPLGRSAFDQGKSGWKLFQYMAAGKPVVASRTDFIQQLVEDGVTGFVVDTALQFEQRLRDLAANPELRRRMGRRAQDFIAARYDIEVGADMLAQLFRGAVEARRTGGGAASSS